MEFYSLQCFFAYSFILSFLELPFKSQNRKCNHCGLTFRDGDVWEIDHIIPRSLGEDSCYANLHLLHRHCHDTKTASDGSLRRTYDKGQIIEEPNEAKVSSSVLKTSGSRKRVP